MQVNITEYTTYAEYGERKGEIYLAPETITSKRCSESNLLVPVYKHVDVRSLSDMHSALSLFICLQYIYQKIKILSYIYGTKACRSIIVLLISFTVIVLDV